MLNITIILKSKQTSTRFSKAEKHQMVTINQHETRMVDIGQDWHGLWTNNFKKKCRQKVFKMSHPRHLPVFNPSGLLTSLWARVHGAGVSVPCCGVLPLFTSTEGGYCQVAKETHWKENVCHRWDVQIQFQVPTLSACPSASVRIWCTMHLVRILRKFEIFYFFFATILLLFHIWLREGTIQPTNYRTPSLRERFLYYSLADERCDIFVWL